MGELAAEVLSQPLQAFMLETALTSIPYLPRLPTPVA
jgi:hypothetical protein